MYTYQIEQFLEERNYIIKKASDLLKLIDVDISTQIKNVTFKPESNDYYIRTVDIVDGKPEERIFKFHVFTIEEYHNDCRTLGIIPEDLEETKPVIEQQEIIPFKQPTEVIPFKITGKFVFFLINSISFQVGNVFTISNIFSKLLLVWIEFIFSKFIALIPFGK